ncbi:hypothetical protein Pyn_16202 [Prunus yedoensis var. nudiflora]|uniref:Uncharacterized protein n=1 Tax=Prunus yedoensis var. nudiflora TaxID=2094558 RepID=A0A314ZT59_PRUYE|nr:hypothetical protein Pyn_16202 [Prunus yedoensis var. nudiflora]
MWMIKKPDLYALAINTFQRHVDYLHLKEHGCEVLDFDGFACPLLDLEALTIVETMSFDLSHFFDDIEVDEDATETLKKEDQRQPNPIFFGKGKDMETDLKL